MQKGFEKIIICSEPQDIEDIVKLTQKEKIPVISFSLVEKLALQKIGICCYAPDDLFPLPDVNKIGIDNLKRVKLLCELIDQGLQGTSPLLKEHGIKIFRSSYFIIKVFYDTALLSYLLLQGLLTSLHCSEIIFFENRWSANELVEGRHSVVPFLIESVFCNQGIRLTKVKSRQGKYSKIFTFAGNFMASYLSQYYKFFREKCAKGKKHTVVLLDSRHDIPHLVENVLRDVRCFPFPVSAYTFCLGYPKELYPQCIKKVEKDKNHVKEIADFFYGILENQVYRELLHNDNNMNVFLHKCFMSYAISVLGSLLPHFDKVKKWLLDISPKALLTASCRLDMKNAYFFELSKALKIPVIVYQEGGGAGYLEWPLFEIDTELSDYFILYGNGVTKSFLSQNKSQLMPLGSIRLEKIAKQISNKFPSRITIYVIMDNMKLGMYQHYPYNGGFFSQAYNHQLKILDVLKRFNDVTFVIKTVKGREFLYESYIKDNTVRIETRPMPLVMDDASAFVIEFPSTVLQECLLTDKPVALFYDNNNVKFESEALELLRRRVRVSFNPDEFHETISLLIEDVKNGTAMAKDKLFLNDYCSIKDAEKNLKSFFVNFFQCN